MAGARKKEKRDWPDEVEQACRNAVSGIPSFTQSTTELEWCEAVAEGLDAYLSGIKMRIEELSEETD
jgi:hypothetical protein